MPITARSHSHLCEPKTLPGLRPRPPRAGRWALTLLAVLAAAALAPAAQAQVVSNPRPGVAVYGTPRIINVGILRLGGPTAQNASSAFPTTGTPLNEANADQLRGAYLFYILNQRPDILPSIWTLKNPSAPSHVDATITSRFPYANTGYTQDTPVTQNMAPYWEINGDTITTTLGLSAYDLILITTNQPIAFTQEQRRAIRQFVDKGGTLWIDTATGGTIGPLDQSLIFHATFGSTANGLNATSTNDLSHPLATGYYTLSSSDLDSLGVGFGNGRQIVSNVNGNVGNSPDPTLFHAVETLSTTTGSNFGSIVAANYGNGHILITDRAISDAINNHVGIGSTNPFVDASLNQGGFCGTNFLNAPAADLKFVVNVLAWASNADGPSGGGRGDNAQPGASTGALQSNWTFPLTGTGATPPGVEGIATYGNRVYVTTSDGYLRCFSVNPGQSLAYGADTATTSGDNYLDLTATDPVTGVKFSADYSKGYPYDEIWARQVDADKSNISAPVVAEIPVGQSGAMVNTPEVLVETPTGVVYASNAVSGTTDGTYGGDNSQTFAAPAPAPAPTYYRGRIFATQADGYVRVTNTDTAVMPFKTQVEMAAGATLSAPFIQSIPGSDMQGYNGEDVVGYIYDAKGSSDSNIYALMFGSRDEHLQYLAFNGGGAGTSTYQTIEQKIPGLAGLGVLGPPEDTDNILTGAYWLYNFPNTSGSYQNTAMLQAESATPPVTTNTIQNANAPLDLSGDYDLQQPATGGPITMTRTTVNTNLAGSTTQTAQIEGIGVSSVSQGIAASLSNVTTAFNTANNFYVTGNEGSIGYIMSVKERAPSAAISFIAWRFALVNTTDADGVTYNFAGYQFVGAPVSDGNGYVYALAMNPNTKTTILMAFFANAVCGFIAPYTATAVTQTDELGNSESILPTQYANNIFSNFSAAQSAVLQPNLTMPLPLTIQGASANGGPAENETVAVSTSLGAQPLLAWWVQLPVSLGTGLTPPTVTPTSPLRKIGNTLYFGGQEQSTSATGGANYDYALFGIYADPTGIGLQPDPMTRQITSSDYRFVQVTPSGVGPVSIPPAGTGKYVITGSSPYPYINSAGTPSTGSGGIEGLGYTPTLVADNHRLVELDPSGNATWVVDSTREPVTQTASTGSAAAQTVVPLNRPTSVTQFSTDDYLLADTGNNRIIHIGRIGDVLTEFPDKYGHLLMATTRAQTTPTAVSIPHALEITGFTDPTGILAPGEPTTLNHPANVTFWLTYNADPTVLVTPPTVTVIVAHYLICDTGNSRIVEVDDTYTQDTALGGANSTTYDFAQDQDYHQLVWVTKTTANGHPYKYVAAQALFPSTPPTGYNQLLNGPLAILAAVSNARVANLTTTTTAAPALAPANQDSQGSAVLVLNYAPVTGQTYQTTANPTPTSINPYLAYYSTGPNPDGLPFAVINTVQADGATATASYPLRGLRSVQAYGFNPPTSTTTLAGTQLGLVIADDDGVFDGSYDAASATVLPGVLDATTATGGWSFRQDNKASVMEDDYTPIVTQYDALLDAKSNQPLTGADASNDYAGTSFSPASALRLGNNTYLIVNRGGAGNPNGVPQFPATGETGTDFGGNVFLVRAKSGANGLRANGGTLSGVIFGKPANTSALDGPSFALRSN